MVLWAAPVPTPRCGGRSSSRGTGWNGRVGDTAVPLVGAGLAPETPGRGQVEEQKYKIPFPARDPLLRSLGRERRGWLRPPWAQRGRGDALGLRRRVLPSPSPGETELGATETAPHRRPMEPLCALGSSGHPGSQGMNPLAEPMAAAAPLEQLLQQTPDLGETSL